MSEILLKRVKTNSWLNEFYWTRSARNVENSCVDFILLVLKLQDNVDDLEYPEKKLQGILVFLKYYAVYHWKNINLFPKYV